MKQFILVVGNVIDGLEFIGPFHDASTANNYGNLHVSDEFYVTQINAGNLGFVMEPQQEDKPQ